MRVFARLKRERAVYGAPYELLCHSEEALTQFPAADYPKRLSRATSAVHDHEFTHAQYDRIHRARFQDGVVVEHRYMRRDSSVRKIDTMRLHRPANTNVQIAKCGGVRCHQDARLLLRRFFSAAEGERAVEHEIEFGGIDALGRESGHLYPRGEHRQSHQGAAGSSGGAEDGLIYSEARKYPGSCGRIDVCDLQSRDLAVPQRRSD